MDNSFDIAVPFDGDEYIFPAELISSAFNYSIKADLFGKSILFERDEEQNFRALIKPEELQQASLDGIDKDLIEAVAKQLMVLFND